MSVWLRPGGYCSHVIDLSAHYLSPFWNGHWAYSDWQWKLVRGRREFLLNREPLRAHLAYAVEAGFEVLTVDREFDNSGLSLANAKIAVLNDEDIRTRSALLILRKP